MKRMVFALVLALCLFLGVLSGCGSTGREGASANAVDPSGSDASVSETPAEGTVSVGEAIEKEAVDSFVEDGAEESEEPVWEYVPIAYPIADGDVVLDYWLTFELSPDTVYSDINDHVVVRELLDATGVRLNILAQSFSAGPTNTELMIASGDYPDLIGGFSYGAGMDAAIEDDVVLNIKEIIPEFSPDYYRYLTENNGDLWRAVQTDQGNIGAYVTVGTEAEITDGMMVFDYMLEELGFDLENLRTLEQYEDFLTAARNTYGMASPMYLPGDFMMLSDAVCSAYGVALKIDAITGDLPWSVVDGTVTFGYLEDGFTEYVTLMHDWFEKGLIDSDTASHPTEYKDDEIIGLIANRQVAVWNRGAGLVDLFTNLSGESVHPAYFPVQTEGDQLHLGVALADISGESGLVITTGCDDPELAMEFVNYLYTDEFYLPSNYGVEGETYDIVDGKPEFQEWTYSTPGRTFSSVILDYQLFVMVDANVETPGQSEASLSCAPMWKSNMDGDWEYPNAAAMTQAENDTYNQCAGDIVTLCQQYTAKFITGDMPLSEISAFQEMLHTTGIDQCIEAKQSAYDRYMSRE